MDDAGRGAALALVESEEFWCAACTTSPEAPKEFSSVNPTEGGLEGLGGGGGADTAVEGTGRYDVELAAVPIALFLCSAPARSVLVPPKL